MLQAKVKQEIDVKVKAQLRNQLSAQKDRLIKR